MTGEEGEKKEKKKIFLLCGINFDVLFTERGMETIGLSDIHCQHSDSLKNHQCVESGCRSCWDKQLAFHWLSVLSLIAALAFTATAVEMTLFKVSRSQLMGHISNHVSPHLSLQFGFCLILD